MYRATEENHEKNFTFFKEIRTGISEIQGPGNISEAYVPLGS